MKKLLFPALAVIVALTGCTEDIPSYTSGSEDHKLTTIEAAKAYFERQLAGEVMVSSTVRLTDADPGGWRMNFTGGDPAVIDLMNGSGGTVGLTPKLVVRHNADGSTTLWVEEDDQLVQTRVQLTGPVEQPIIPGVTGVSPKLDVRRDAGGTLTVWFNDVYGYPDTGWKNTGVKLRAGSGTGSAAEMGPFLAVIDNEPRGVVGIWLNDAEHTVYRFDKFSPTARFNIMHNEVSIREGETGKITMLVTPSKTWVPTGYGEWINRWELNCMIHDHLDTRAGYVQECHYFSIESVLPSGRGEGEYHVTVRAEQANLNEFDGGGIHSLVLNTNTEKNPMLVSSTRFLLGQSLPPSANCIMVKPNSSVDINMAQIIREYQAGFTSAPRIQPGDHVTADWVWSCKPYMLTPQGAVAKLEVMTPPDSGLNTEFRVTTGPQVGNAVIAAKVNDRIVWSWHIWVTEYDPDTQGLVWDGTNSTPRYDAPDAGKPHVFMDRNLGARRNDYSHDTPDDYGANGLFYQWGRKDPFRGNYNNRSGGDLPIIYTPEARDQGRFITISSPSTTAGIRYSVEHPDEFITMPNPVTGYWSWNDLSPESLAWLWYDGTDVSFRVTKSVYDPCPVGWRLPSRGLVEGYSAVDGAATAMANRGYNNTPFGFIPYSGYVDYQGNIIPDVARFVFYTSQRDIPVWFSEWSNGRRYEVSGGAQLARNGSNAYSARCIKEDSE